MKKLNMSLFTHVTLLDIGSFLIWILKVQQREPVTLRKIKVAAPIRTNRVSFMLKLGEEFGFLQQQRDYVVVTESGKLFANANLQMQMSIARDLLMTYNRVQELIGLLNQAPTRRLKIQQVEKILGIWPSYFINTGDAIGFVEWAHTCDLFYYDKKKGEIVRKVLDLPTKPMPSVSVAL